MFWDFLNAYYPAGQAALHDDPAMLRDRIGKGLNGFVNIPVVAYWFAPLGWLTPQIAATLSTVIGIGLTVAAGFLLIRLAGLELRERWLLALFALAGGLVLLRAGRSGATAFFLGSQPPFASSRIMRGLGWLAIVVVTPLVMRPALHLRHLAKGPYTGHSRYLACCSAGCCGLYYSLGG